MVIVFTLQRNLAKFISMCVCRELIAVCRLPDCAGVPWHKIRGESSSNGSECGVPVSLRTKIRAELSSNGSWRSRRHSSSWTPAVYGPLEVLLLLFLSNGSISFSSTSRIPSVRLLFQQHPPSRPLLLLDSYLIDLLVLVKLSR